jgi:hypothetical protein
MDWQRPLSRAGFLSSLAAAGYFAAEGVSKNGPLRRWCSTVYSTVTQTVTTTVTQPPPPPPGSPPPPPVPLGTDLPAALPQSTGTNYFSSTTGNDTTGDGSIGNPWLTITKALQQKGAETGAIINLRGGTYIENVNVANCHGISSNPITIRPHEEEPVTVKKLAAAGSNFPFTFNNWDYARITGLIIDGDSINNSGVEDADVYFTGGSTFVVVENCEVKNSYEQAILADDGTADCQVLANWIHDGGTIDSGSKDHAIYFQGDRHLIANNLIHDYDFGHNVQLYPSSRNHWVVNNTIAHVLYDNVSPFYKSAAIVVGSDVNGETSNDHTIANNLIFAAPYGIEGYTSLGPVKSLSGGITLPVTPITLSNVTSMDTLDGQVAIGSLSGTVDTALVAYTGVSGADITGCTTLYGSGQTWATSTQVRANTIDRLSGTGTVAHHNAFWTITNIKRRLVAQGGALPIISFDGNDVESDPLVVDDTTRDYHLSSGSPLYAAGVEALCPTTDKDGNARTVATIGAFRAAEEVGLGWHGRGTL